MSFKDGNNFHLIYFIIMKTYLLMCWKIPHVFICASSSLWRWDFLKKPPKCKFSSRKEEQVSQRNVLVCGTKTNALVESERPWMTHACGWMKTRLAADPTGCPLLLLFVPWRGRLPSVGETLHARTYSMYVTWSACLSMSWFISSNVGRRGDTHTHLRSWTCRSCFCIWFSGGGCCNCVACEGQTAAESAFM